MLRFISSSSVCTVNRFLDIFFIITDNQKFISAVPATAAFPIMAVSSDRVPDCPDQFITSIMSVGIVNRLESVCADKHNGTCLFTGKLFPLAVLIRSVVCESGQRICVSRKLQFVLIQFVYLINSFPTS